MNTPILLLKIVISFQNAQPAFIEAGWWQGQDCTLKGVEQSNYMLDTYKEMHKRFPNTYDAPVKADFSCHWDAKEQE